MKKLKYILILHIVLAVYSFLVMASKLAAGEAFLSPKFLVYYGVVLSTLFAYALVWQQLLKKLPLFTAYANKAVTIVWGIVWGYIFFDEPITMKKMVGAIVIFIGVCFVVAADYKNEKEESDNK